MQKKDKWQNSPHRFAHKLLWYPCYAPWNYCRKKTNLIWCPIFSTSPTSLTGWCFPYIHSHLQCENNHSESHHVSDEKCPACREAWVSSWHWRKRKVRCTIWCKEAIPLVNDRIPGRFSDHIEELESHKGTGREMSMKGRWRWWICLHRNAKNKWWSTSCLFVLTYHPFVWRFQYPNTNSSYQPPILWHQNFNISTWIFFQYKRKHRKKTPK